MCQKKEIYVNHLGNFGQGKMPKEYGGVKFWKFHPSDIGGKRVEKVDLFIEYWRPNHAKQGGYFVANQILKIAGVKL